MVQNEERKSYNIKPEPQTRLEMLNKLARLLLLFWSKDCRQAGLARSPFTVEEIVTYKRTSLLPYRNLTLSVASTLA